MQYYTYDHSDVLDRSNGLAAQLVSWVKTVCTTKTRNSRPCRVL